MAESENKPETVEEAAANPMADAPKKNAVPAEPSHIASMNDAEDLGSPVVKPTDSNPDSTKKVKQVVDAVSKSAQVGSEPSP